MHINPPGTALWPTSVRKRGVGIVLSAVVLKKSSHRRYSSSRGGPARSWRVRKAMWDRWWQSHSSFGSQGLVMGTGKCC